MNTPTPEETLKTPAYTLGSFHYAYTTLLIGLLGFILYHATHNFLFQGFSWQIIILFVFLYNLSETLLLLIQKNVKAVKGLAIHFDFCFALLAYKLFTYALVGPTFLLPSAQEVMLRMIVSFLCLYLCDFGVVTYYLKRLGCPPNFEHWSMYDEGFKKTRD